MSQDYNELKLDELKELAKERDLEGRSGLNKDELAKALAEDDAANVGTVDSGVSEEAQKEYREEYVPQRAKENEEAIKETGDPLPSVGYKSEASDPDNPVVEEKLEDKPVYDELSDEDKELADLALDASGPNNLESPYERIVTGAVSEEQAKEQEKERAKLPKNYVGDYPEKVSDEFAKRAELLHGDGKADDEEYALNDPRRVIDFPPAFRDVEQKDS